MPEKRIFFGESYVKNRLLALSLLFSIITSTAFAQAPTRRSAATVTLPAVAQTEFKVPFVNKKLANGLEVIVLPDSSVPLVTVELAVRNGSFTEPPELNG